jgi:thioredoxin 1
MANRQQSTRTFPRWIWAVGLVAVAVGVYAMRPAASGDDTPDAGAEVHGNIPRLVDLGADKCIPCKQMAPILEELKTEYAGRFDVTFIDVWKNTNAGAEYGVRVIPTQIWFSADGNELHRHEGFIGKEDILATWRELGVDIGS